MYFAFSTATTSLRTEVLCRLWGGIRWGFRNKQSLWDCASAFSSRETRKRGIFMLQIILWNEFGGIETLSLYVWKWRILSLEWI
jgi:hypothetical protein